jgi:formamidopyrimidine-DNA glycosylase
VPELPDVEAARVEVGRVVAGKVVARVWCADDPIVFEGVPAARFRRALVGRRIVRLGRRGKHLWFELDRRPWLTVHFGMTGGLHLPARPAARRRSSTIVPDGAWPPRFARLRLVFTDGDELAGADARRLGRIRLRHDPAGEPPISALGFDALLELPRPRAFVALVGARTAPMKALLLDQTFAAGVGNWIADEVLYQARVAPRRRADTLTPAEALRVRASLRRVIALSVRVGSDSARFPRAWLFHDRWGKRPDAVTPRGDSIRHDTIGGRTTAWVPALQR